MNQDQPQGTVVLAYGPQPVSFFKSANKMCGGGKDAILDQDTARMAGAMTAIGTPAALLALRQRLEAGALQAELAKNPGLSEAAVNWLAHGERGTSSETIFTVLTGVDALKGSRKDHPYDPSDFRRCQLLLEQVPELQQQFPRMAMVSDAWARLVKSWPAIIAAMDEEAPGWRTNTSGQMATKAYELIKQTIGR